MRFPGTVFAVAALLVATATCSLAQRGTAGGHSGAVGHASGATPARGAIAGRGSVAGYTGLRSPVAGYTGIRPGALRSRGDYRRVPYAYFFSPYYYPFLDYTSAPYGGSPYDVPDDPNAEAAIMAESSLGQQIQRLSAQVDQLTYNQQAQQAASSGQQDPQAVAQTPPVMLVLHSGQKIEVQSYAVMDQTFWDFTREPPRKIPISSIDIAASAKATEARGGEFPQLDSGQYSLQ